MNLKEQIVKIIAYESYCDGSIGDFVKKEDFDLIADNIVKLLDLHIVSNRRELLLDFSYKLRKLLNFTHQQPLDKYVDYYEEGKL